VKSLRSTSESGTEIEKQQGAWEAGDKAKVCSFILSRIMH
jgi:hypothetical protein